MAIIPLNITIHGTEAPRTLNIFVAVEQDTPYVNVETVKAILRDWEWVDLSRAWDYIDGQFITASGQFTAERSIQPASGSDDATYLYTLENVDWLTGYTLSYGNNDPEAEVQARVDGILAVLGVTDSRTRSVVYAVVGMLG